jgi:hypothetical protein
MINKETAINKCVEELTSAIQHLLPIVDPAPTCGHL